MSPLKAFFLLLCLIMTVLLISLYSYKHSPLTVSRKTGVMNVEKTEFMSSSVPLQSQSRSTTNKHSIGGKDGTAVSTNATVKGAPKPYVRDKLELTKLHWTSLYGKGEKDSYHFFAAYYDGRASAPDRPVVIVLGYVRRNVAAIKLYCLFKFTNGSETCLKQPAEEKILNCYNHNALGRQHLCKMSTTKEPPISIRMSTKSSCELASNSGEIPVQNRLSGAKVKVKKFGVCLGGPVVQKDNTTLQKLVQFIEMNRVLGAEVIYFYINQMQIHSDVLKYILEHYSSDIVRVIEWKKFKPWNPLHYYGQLLIMNDCLLRNMYEVEYIVMNDLDEIILPMKHNNWREMLSFHDSKKYASYTFQNRFLLDSPRPSTPLQLSNNCIAGLQVPMYFTRRTMHPCRNPGDRTKFIVRPRIALQPAVHGMCTSIGGYITGYKAPAHLGINAHYRDGIPKKCQKQTGNFKQVNVAMKFASRIIRNMCAHYHD